MKTYTTRRIVQISYFTLLTIVGGLVRIPIPFTTIMMTLQTLFVVMAGLVLGPRDGAFSQIAYMVLGLIGLPIFTGGGGIMYVLRPSFGYILSFPFAAMLAGFLVRRLKTLSPLKVFMCGMAGVLLNYGVGIPYQVFAMMFLTSTPMPFMAALLTVPGVLLMLIKDTVLMYLVALLYPRIMSMLRLGRQPIAALAEEQPLSPPVKEPEKGDEDDAEQTEKKNKEKPKVPVPATQQQHL